MNINILISIVFCLVVTSLLNLETDTLNASNCSDADSQKFSNGTMSLEYLGLKGTDLTKERASEFSFQEPFGFFVTDVLESSPAEESADFPLLKNDVILEVDNQDVYNRSSLESYLKTKKIGENLFFTIARNQTIFNNVKILDMDLLAPETHSAPHVSLPPEEAAVKLYSDPDNNFILQYPSKYFTLNEYEPNRIAGEDISYESSQIYKEVNFEPTNNTDLNGGTFRFDVTFDVASFESLRKGLDESHIKYQEKINKTNDINDQSTNTLEYSYHDPGTSLVFSAGEMCGISFYTEFNDKAVTLTYENTAEKYHEWLPSIRDIVDSVKLVHLKPLLWSENGFYFEVPSSWQILDQESNLIRLGLSDYSNLTISHSTAYGLGDEISLNGTSPTEITNNNTEAVKCDSLLDRNYDTYTEISCEFHDKFYTLTFAGEYGDLAFTSPFINNIIDKSIQVSEQRHLSPDDYEIFSKGTITHPFSMKYPSAWNFTESATEVIGKSVEFRPNDTNSNVSLSISYWNENNLPMIEEEENDRKLIGDSYGGEQGFSNRGIDLNNKLHGKTTTYYSFNLDGITYVQRIFYLKDNFDGNVKLIYTAPVDEYLEYWPIAETMIQSVDLHRSISALEAHGITVGDSPSGIFYDGNDDVIFVVNQRSRSISVINAANFQAMNFGQNRDLSLENVTSEPFDLAYNSVDKSLYVTHLTTNFAGTKCISGAITKMQFNLVNENTPFDNPTKSILINEKRGFCPVDIVVNKDNVVFAADPFSQKLYVIPQEGKNTTEVSLLNDQSYSFMVGGIGLALDETANRIYIANPVLPGVQIFDIDKRKIEDSRIRTDVRNFRSCPIDIATDPELNRSYVVDTNDLCSATSTLGNGVLVVIDSKTGNIMEDTIEIGKMPSNVVVDRKTHKIYVTNMLSDSLTVIDPLTFTTTTANIAEFPFGVTNNPNRGLVYATSQGSSSVLMIDANTNKINHLVTLKVNPLGSGQISCHGSSMTQDQLSFVPDNAKCIAEPTKLSSFVFQSWSDEEGKIFETEGNKSLIAQVLVKPITSMLDSSNTSAELPLETVMGMLDSPSSNTELPVTTSGTFTANFVQSNSIITQEQLTGLYALAVGLFSTWLIPNVTHWVYSGRKSRIQNSRFSSYLKDIHYLDLDKALINTKRGEILESLSKGELSESQYSALDEKLSKLELGLNP